MTTETGTGTTRSFGAYGGRYVPETLIPALDELTAGWAAAQQDPTFRAELDRLAATYAGRPTPLTLAERFAPGKSLYLKREDLMHTGAHKLNNALGQAVLAQRLGKKRIVAGPRAAEGGRRGGAGVEPRGGRPPARGGRRLRRRRLERGRDVCRFPRRRGRPGDRRRGRGRRLARQRPHRRAPRLALLDPRRRGRPDRGRPFDLRGPRLSGCGPRARVPARLGPRAVPAGHG